MTHNTAHLVNNTGLVEDVALGTLAARTALALDTDFNAITNTFLMKRYRVMIYAEGLTSAEGPICVGIARGDATVAEIATAMLANNRNGPSDTTGMLTQDSAWVVAQNSIIMATLGGSVLSHREFSSEWMPVGGSKGIPWQEGSGWQLFVFNLDNAALGSGAIIKGIVQYQGVWLRG